MKTLRSLSAALAVATLALGGCGADEGAEAKPRMMLFVGMDVSGSFQKGPYAEDAKDFLARYLYAHLNGQGGLPKPESLFVGAIGGTHAGEPKSFQPIEAFAGKDLGQIRATLEQLFPKGQYNNDTDFNAFLKQAGQIMLERNSALKPVTVLMMTDGIVDLMDVKGGRDYAQIDLSPLERYSRNVTLRLCYTDPQAAADWKRLVPRQRARIWTQNADVMVHWKDSNILTASTPPALQPALFHWIQDNVDYGVRVVRVE